LEPRKGGRLYVAWNNGTALSGTYTALTPLKKVAFNLRGADQALPAEIQVSISSRNGKTGLALTESSTDKQWAKRGAELEAGWTFALENLRSVLETGQDLRLVQRPMLG